jgi:uncharacterized membrane protein YsdA (DUF1294 family)/cold shock CspA family protein
MRMQGKVTQWQDGKGFGFIDLADGTPTLFFHENFLLHQTRRPRVGDTVSFEIATNSDGHRRAERILFPGERDPKRVDHLVDFGYIALACLFFLCIGLFVYQQKLNPGIAFVYLFVSFITFFLYWHDKTKAKKNRWRTSEQTLHLFSLAGGWPGALIAQRTLHHKSRKRSFQIIFATTILLNLVFVTLYTTHHRDFNASDIVSNTYITLRDQLHSLSDQQAQHKKNGPVYSWTNKNGKRVYSTVGFPADEPYAEGKIEWH